MYTIDMTENGTIPVVPAPAQGVNFASETPQVAVPTVQSPQQTPTPTMVQAAQQAPTQEMPQVPPQFAVPPDMRPQPEQIVFEWTAPNRPFKKKNRQYYVTIAMILFLISMILFFAGQFILIAVAIAAGFLLYVMSAIPPEMVLNQITTYGIRTDGQLYSWEELGRFWFTVRQKQDVLHVEVSRFPNHLTLLPAEVPREQLVEILSNVLLQEQPLPTTFDRAAAWVQQKIQLDPEA